MEQSIITVVISGNTYSLSANDLASIGKIPSSDRQQLIALLEAVKQQEGLAAASAKQAVDEEKASLYAATTDALAGSAVDHQDVKPERLGSGDVDALMARLIQEERNSQKPGLTKQAMYKIIFGFAAVVILLILVL